MGRYKVVAHEGIRFFFAYDKDDPTLLHIYARHLTSIDDALDVWFDPDASDEWNEQYDRFESQNASHLLYWTWLEYGRRVLIITCMELED